MFQLLQSLNPVAFALLAITACMTFVAAIAFTVSHVTRFQKPYRFVLSRDGFDMARGDDFDEMVSLARKDTGSRPASGWVYDVTDYGANGAECSHHTVLRH